MSLCDVTTCNLYRTLALPGQLLTFACSDSSTCTFFSISLVLWGPCNLKPGMIPLFCLTVYPARLWYNCFFVQKICRYLSSVCRDERNSLNSTCLRSLMCVIWRRHGRNVKKTMRFNSLCFGGWLSVFQGKLLLPFSGQKLEVAAFSDTFTSTH
jgi:hypothetical protein